MRTALWILVAIVFLVLFFTGLGEQLGADTITIDRSYNERFEVGDEATLRLEHGDGDVVITPWDQAAIEVDIVYRSEHVQAGWVSQGDFEATFHQNGDVVRVIGREPSRTTIGIQVSRSESYRYTIRAPRHTTIDLVGDDGDVSIEGWGGTVLVETDDGDVDVHGLEADRLVVRGQDGVIDLTELRLTGALTIEADDGDVEVRGCTTTEALIEVEDGDVVVDGCSGDFEVVSDDGDLQIERHTSDRLRLRTGDGGIGLVLARGGVIDLTVETDDGSVSLDLPPDISASLVIESDGSMQVEGSAARDVKERENRLDATLGAGEGSIRVISGDGRVRVRAG